MAGNPMCHASRALRHHASPCAARLCCTAPRGVQRAAPTQRTGHRKPRHWPRCKPPVLPQHRPYTTWFCTGGCLTHIYAAAGKRQQEALVQGMFCLMGRSISDSLVSPRMPGHAPHTTPAVWPALATGDCMQCGADTQPSGCGGPGPKPSRLYGQWPHSLGWHVKSSVDRRGLGQRRPERRGGARCCFQRSMPVTGQRGARPRVCGGLFVLRGLCRLLLFGRLQGVTAWLHLCGCPQQHPDLSFEAVDLLSHQG
mmetsp:Transcript_88886/g.276137  ORF Transcript_88886/g.276137 Transcript_88886/m.276137 type:complete len:254 (-) Transcript_88886:817-1578(-)